LSSISMLDAPALTIAEVDPLPLRADLRDVHRAALGAGALSDEWAAKRLPLHTRRGDFVFLAARAGTEVVGFGYGYTGAFGQWWTERVAAALTVGQREQWLDPPHFEIVELHVRPSWQRRGVGSALLAQVLSRQRHDRALLSTQTGSRKARGFYAKNGWAELADVDFGTGYPPYLVLGKLLGPAAERSYLPATELT
jgi:GNAT superfamily N-acetyltransferase